MNKKKNLNRQLRFFEINWKSNEEQQEQRLLHKKNNK